MSDYYIYNKQQKQYVQKANLSPRLISEAFKKATEDWMQANGVNHLKFVKKEDYDEEIARVEYELARLE